VPVGGVTAVPDGEAGVPAGLVGVPDGLAAVPPAGFAGLPIPPPLAPAYAGDGAGLGPPDAPPAFAAAKDEATFDAMPLNTSMVSSPGIRERPPIPSPVNAGLSPTLLIMSSILRPHFVMPTMRISHGITEGPEGILTIADNKSFKHTTFIIIIKHMLANIRTHPLNMSAVLLLPPIAKPNGARIVKSTSTT
jgi:hypothetical protein